MYRNTGKYDFQSMTVAVPHPYLEEYKTACFVRNHTKGYLEITGMSKKQMISRKARIKSNFLRQGTTIRAENSTGKESEFSS